MNRAPEKYGALISTPHAKMEYKWRRTEESQKDRKEVEKNV